MINFIRKFLTRKSLLSVKEEININKIFTKKLFNLLSEMIRVFILENEKMSMLLLFRYIFEEEISNYFLYKMIVFLYKFKERGKIYNN